MSFLGIKNPFRTGAGAVRRDATNAAAARQGRAANLSTFIGQTFNDPRREQQTQDFMGALRTQLGDTTDRGFRDLSRGTKFATARQGLTGGRVDVDRQNRNLEALFRQRVGDEGQVQDAGNQLRSQDLSTRQSLLDSAYGAADVGQDAMRRLLGQRADLAAGMGGMLPGFIMNTGGQLAGAFDRRRFMQGLTGGMAPAPATATPPLYAWNTPTFGGNNA